MTTKDDYTTAVEAASYQCNYVVTLVHYDSDGEIQNCEFFECISFHDIALALNLYCARITNVETCWFPANHPGPCDRFYLQGTRFDVPGNFEICIDLQHRTISQSSTGRILRLLNS